MLERVFAFVLKEGLLLNLRLRFSQGQSAKNKTGHRNPACGKRGYTRKKADSLCLSPMTPHRSGLRAYTLLQ
jgi:hypothetical protein